MSYSKLKITYYTDGVNTNASVNTRQGNKHRTLALPQTVQEYGDKYGYSRITIDYLWDRLILKGGGEVLMDVDINGTDRWNGIERIVSYEWTN